ncbi:hypothetical protein EDEG_03629 [Edhazardia aedis USNM 41457]|uniref:Uncharacterized protein n=1 Tax=Edhazardia aedis (strain USNM 41457) TaxID=1003232 RepID=J9D210_EDHAE|nr:hypothetical protein EDEG_03629 [Edhazardia aedis USNM 41457]|eukprot:EJW01896.1 hypothetical protein EDEG_03629 [Edhazardia aedis USNM 41457]
MITKDTLLIPFIFGFGVLIFLIIGICIYNHFKDRKSYKKNFEKQVNEVKNNIPSNTKDRWFYVLKIKKLIEKTVANNIKFNGEGFIATTGSSSSKNTEHMLDLKLLFWDYALNEIIDDFKRLSDHSLINYYTILLEDSNLKIQKLLITDIKTICASEPDAYIVELKKISEIIQKIFELAKERYENNSKNFHMHVKAVIEEINRNLLKASEEVPSLEELKSELIFKTQIYKDYNMIIEEYMEKNMLLYFKIMHFFYK